MLLIELISISNMGVTLIETCFCSRLYGRGFHKFAVVLSIIYGIIQGTVQCATRFDLATGPSDELRENFKRLARLDQM